MAGIRIGALPTPNGGFNKPIVAANSSGGRFRTDPMPVSTLTERVISRPEFIALVAALMALNSLAIDVMLPALPAIGASLGVASENERQYVIAAYMIGFGVAQLAFG